MTLTHIIAKIILSLFFALKLFRGIETLAPKSPYKISNSRELFIISFLLIIIIACSITGVVVAGRIIN